MSDETKKAHTFEKKASEDFMHDSFASIATEETDTDELDTLLLDVKLHHKRSSVEFLELRLISITNWYLYATTSQLSSSQS